MNIVKSDGNMVVDTIGCRVVKHVSDTHEHDNDCDCERSDDILHQDLLDLDLRPLNPPLLLFESTMSIVLPALPWYFLCKAYTHVNNTITLSIVASHAIR
jgi:hypothetical protein